tara:strand:+ start:945 stop:1226 length:282 start_codon:yes stop_codon:yes gene_type:complete
MNKISYMQRIIRMVTKSGTNPCEMCKDEKIGKRWEYRPQTLIVDYLSSILIVCEKCIYRENYGTKVYKKAIKQKLLDKLNHNYGKKLPKVEGK